MNLLLDTSVLVASMVENHPHHPPSLKLIKNIRKSSKPSFIAAHTLAECYATLTALPLPTPIAPLQANELVRLNLQKLFEIIPLTTQDYLLAIGRVAQKNLRSGIIYDALIVHAALKRKISTLVSWNLKDYSRICPEGLTVATPDSL